MSRTPGISANLNAFLDTIAFSELGADILAASDDGYDVLVGSVPGMVLKFGSYARHPGVVINYSPGHYSSAAGRYQIMAHNWTAYSVSLGLKDFSPPSQEAISIQMIHECAALDDIEAGNVQAALTKCASRWASFPASTYGQHLNRMNDLLAAYKQAGGQGASA